ncbi:MAG: phosphate butyryltransferase, partial [Bacteroidales bacterium]|nr:phosphate butyryltransferase [Bacteroidales bacterium]
MIKNFNDVFETLKAKGICKRMVVAWGVDEHSIEAAYKAVEKGFVSVTLVGDAAKIAAVCADNGL